MSKIAKYKYITNLGLAFDEERTLRKLNSLAKEGWILDKLTLWRGYRLRKGEPQELVYSMDYKKLDERSQKEYFEMFEMSGWKHICSYQFIHFFAAPHGNIPIYTEMDSHQHKYREQRIYCLRLTLIGIIFLAILFGLAEAFLPQISIEAVKFLIHLLVGITAGCVFSLIMLTVAFFWRERLVIKHHSKTNL